jgi:hypothetical protein
MPPTTRNFHIGDILSITTERLVSPTHMDGVYDILNFMTGDNLFTHQLPRACREMQPRLLAQHPQLANVDASGVTPENCQDWLAEQVKRFSETLPVRTATDFHEVIDPIAEAEARVGSERIVVAEEILAKFAQEQGWSESTQIDVLCRYIDNQQSNAALVDFLQEQADSENAYELGL